MSKAKMTVFRKGRLHAVNEVWRHGVEETEDINSYKSLDKSLSIEMQMKQLCKVLYFQLRRISKIRSFLTVDTADTLAVAFILSRLDYCNSPLAGLPDHKLAKLQHIQNSAARLVLRKLRRKSATPFLKILHWLPVKARI